MNRPVRYTLIFAAIAVLALLVSQSADAESPALRRPKPQPLAVAFQLEDEHGRVLPTFQHEGRTFVLGDPGERYGVRVFNRTAQRVEAVISVDGRDAVSGEIGDFNRQRGYVVDAFGSVLVDGFRRSMDEVAAFRFTSPSNSYSARRGTPQNVGVIGVAFFPERTRAPIAQRPTTWRDRRTQAPEAPRSRAPAPKSRSESAGAPKRADASVNNLGTEYGERRLSSVVEVPFVRASSNPTRVITTRYDDARGLQARGIDVSWLLGSRRRVVEHEPHAFPNSARFAPPPP